VTFKNKIYYTQLDPLLKWAAVFILIGGIKIASAIITPLLLAIFFSIISSQPVRFLRKKGMSKGFAISIVLIVFLSIISFIGGFLGNSIARFTKNIPELDKSLDIAVTNYIEILNSNGFQIPNDQLMDFLDPSKILNFTAATLNSMGNFMGQLFIIGLLAFFMLLEMDSFPLKFNAILGKSNPHHETESTKRIIVNIRNYLGIKTLTSFSTGLLIFIALKVLGVDYAFIWGLIAFLLNYIPNIGSLLAAIPTLIFTIVQYDWQTTAWTALTYLIVNIVIGSLIEPKVMGRGMGLSTLVVIISLIFWGWVLGPIGMFLSVPLTMTLKIFLENYDDTKWLAVMLGTDSYATEIIEITKNQTETKSE
jgi:predicted PurR-regulated permease PerM